MPKGYVISRVDITNPDAYARYATAATFIGLGLYAAASSSRPAP